MDKHLHKYKQLSEHELLEAYTKESDDIAFHELYLRYKDKIKAFIVKKLRACNYENCKYICDELLQETYLNLLTCKSFQNNTIQEYENYLITTTKHTFLRYIKTGKKQKDSKDKWDRTQSFSFVEKNIVEAIEHEAKIIKMEEAIQRLKSDKQR